MRRFPPSGPGRDLVVLSLAGAAVLTLLPFARGADLVRGLWTFGAFVGVLLAFVLHALLRPDAAGRMGAAWERALRRAESRMTARRATLLLAAGMLSYAIVWSLLSIARHEALNSSGFDLAIQHQVVWNLAHGRGYESSIEVAHYLGDHIALTLPLFVPALWVWDDPRSLLIAQSLVLALGAWPVYRLALRRCAGRLDAILWAGVYLLTPAIGFMNKYDFHDLVLALPLLLAALDAIDARRFARASVWLCLAILTREEVGLAAAALGLASGWRHRRLWWGSSVAVLSLSWALFALFVLIPHFRAGDESDTLARYAWLGETPRDVMVTLVTRPWTLFATHYHRVRRLFFVVQLPWSFGMLPLLDLGRLAPAFPNLLLSMASSAISQNSIYFQYNAPILPFFFAAGIEAYRRAGRRARAVALLLLGLAFANLADPAAVKDVGPPYTIVDGLCARPNREAFREAARRIPPGADLLAGNHLAAHFSARRSLAIFHVARPNPACSWVILDVTDRRHIADAQGVRERIASMVDSGAYRPDFFRQGILLLRREGEANREAASALEDSFTAWGVGRPGEAPGPLPGGSRVR